MKKSIKWLRFLASAAVGAYSIVAVMLIGMLKMKASIRLPEYEYLENFLIYGFLTQLFVYGMITRVDEDPYDPTHASLDLFILVAQQPIGMVAVLFATKYPKESVVIYLIPVAIYAFTWLYEALLVYAPSKRRVGG